MYRIGLVACFPSFRLSRYPPVGMLRGVKKPVEFQLVLPVEMLSLRDETGC